MIYLFFKLKSIYLYDPLSRCFWKLFQTKTRMTWVQFNRNDCWIESFCAWRVCKTYKNTYYVSIYICSYIKQLYIVLRVNFIICTHSWNLMPRRDATCHQTHMCVYIYISHRRTHILLHHFSLVWWHFASGLGSVWDDIHCQYSETPQSCWQNESEGFFLSHLTIDEDRQRRL